MAHWKQMKNSKYIGWWDLKTDEEVVLTVKRVIAEEVTGEGGKKSECTVAYMEKGKPMILNSTNCTTIEKMYGDGDPDNWPGISFTVYRSTTNLKGETVSCLRIRPTKPGPKAKRPISDNRLTEALTAISEQRLTTEKLLAQYELTPDQLGRLPKQLEASESQ